MKKFLFLAFLITVISGCAATNPHKNVISIILPYRDFGPQVIAHDLIGMERWQWQSHGDASQKHYPIKVVIYRLSSLKDIRILYPIDQDKKIDYRYVSYKNAITYLNKNISENILPEVTEKLKKTRSRIIFSFGDVSK